MDIDGHQHLEGYHEYSADQNHKMNLVDPLDDLIQTLLHEHACHFEVEIEEGG